MDSIINMAYIPIHVNRKKGFWFKDHLGNKKSDTFSTKYKKCY